MSQVETTEKWIAANEDWLDGDHPLVGSLLMAADAMDADRAKRGAVSAPLVTAFRLTMNDLIKMQPVAADEEDDDPDGLMGTR